MARSGGTGIVIVGDQGSGEWSVDLQKRERGEYEG